MSDFASRRLVPAFRFTVIREPDRVRLVAGEDLRWSLEAAGIEQWLPRVFEVLDGGGTVDEAVDSAVGADRVLVSETLRRLLGERVLVEPTRRPALASPHGFVFYGEGALKDAMGALCVPPSAGQALLHVFVQDSLHLASAMDFNATRLSGAEPFLWATTGPLARAFVSPVFLPSQGPCLECLLRGFRRISPAPELWDALLNHSRAGGVVEPSLCSEVGIAMLVQLILAKRAWLAETEPPAALYDLHVLDLRTLEISTHALESDECCESCSV